MWHASLRNYVFVWQAFGWCPNGTQCPLSHDTDLIVLQDEKSGSDKRKKRKRRKDKNRGEKTAEDSSVLDGAPKSKLAHMEVDPEETPDNQQRAEPRLEREPLVDSDGNTQQNGGDKTKKIECEDSADLRESTSSTKSDADANTKTDTADCTESKTEEHGRGNISVHPKTDDQKKADTGTHRAGFDAFMTGFIFAHSFAFIKKDKVESEEEEKEQQWLPSCLNKVYLSGKAAPLNVVKSTFSKSSKAHVKKMEMVWGGRWVSMKLAFL